MRDRPAVDYPARIVAEMRLVADQGSPTVDNLRNWAQRLEDLTKPKHVMCGGCGNSDPDKRCIGCGHNFSQRAPAICA